MSKPVFPSKLSPATRGWGWIIFLWIAIAMTSGWSALGAPAAEAASHSAINLHAEAAEHHGLPSAAPRFRIPGTPLEITNSMIIIWVVALGIIVFARIATARMKDVPEGAQNFWE